MSENSHIFSKIEQVMHTFREAERLAETVQSYSDVAREIEKFNSEFKSVGYEALSMCISKDCLENENGNLATWTNFFSDKSENYESQLLTGLGWAIAASDKSPFAVIPSNFTPFQQSKINDGFGYYFGLFRSRLVVRSTSLPEIISSNKPSGFDSGLGRAIYYHAKGSPEMLNKFLLPFESERKNELWLGVGTACVFVGGYSEEELITISETAGEYKPFFLLGGLFAVKSRTAANAETQFTSIFINTLFEKLSTFKILSEIELLKTTKCDYDDLLKKILPFLLV